MSRRPAASTIARRIDEALRAAGDPARATQEQAYLKSSLEFYGASVPATRRAVRETLDEVPDLDHDRLVGVVEILWERPARHLVHDRRRAANEALQARLELLDPDDLPLIEHLLRTSGTWALVDDLAAVVVGHLVENDPELADRVLDRWVADDDFWIRRSALLALLIPLRQGGGDWDRFTRYADGLLGEQEFFIRKAIGWVLRDTSCKRPELVAAWVACRANRMSGVTVREAVRHLDPAVREAILAGYRAKAPATLP
jgi:3-methyladenine DNA glycosylase AlkD